MKKNKLSRILIYFLFVFFVQSCAKGPEDEPLSFRSRTNRLVGEYDKAIGFGEMTRYYTSASGAPLDTIYSDGEWFFPGDKYVWLRKFGEITKPATHLSFKKDGSWSRTISFTQLDLNDVLVGTFKLEQTGKWEWNKKVNGYKKKESITVSIESSKETFTYANGVAEAYTHTFPSGSTELWHLLYLGHSQFRAEIIDINVMTYTDQGNTVKVTFKFDSKTDNKIEFNKI